MKSNNIKPIRIFFITTEVPSKNGGGNVRSFNLLKYLRKGGSHVSLFTIVNSKTSNDLISLKKELNIPTYSVQHRTLSPFAKLFYSLISKTIPYMKEQELSHIDKLLLQKIKEEKPDIIHLEHLNSYYAIRKIIPYIKKNNIKLVLDEHNVEYIAFSEGIKSMSTIKRLLGKIMLPKLLKIENHAISNADKVFVCSEVDEKYFKEQMNNVDIDVIPNGVDCEYIDSTKPAKENKLIFMGGMSYPPNNEALKFYFSKIHPLVKASIPDVSIDILGTDPKSWLVELAKKDTTIHIHGHVPDIRPFITNAKVGICPVKSGSGTRLKILEYLGSGKSVVSTHKGAEGIEVTDKKNILFADDPEQFANYIITLCKDNNMASLLGKEGRKLIVRKYQWKMIAESMQKKYYEILNPIFSTSEHSKNPSLQYTLLTPQRVFLLFLFLTVVGISLLTILNLNYLYISSFLSSILLLIIPGFLFLWIISSYKQSISEVITYSLGISIALLMLLGLFINWILPLVKISHPLTFFPILYSLDILVVIFCVILFFQNKALPFNNERVTSIKILITTTFLSFSFPILSILGAISLNNNGNNIFTMFLLGTIAFTVFILTILREKINENVFPITILMIGISLLFMTSLRGWYVTGHDINLETYVFQLTKSHGIWSMANFQDPYNACLSITILPTIISLITHIPDYYIYKVVYQLIFSFTAVLTYLFLKKFINSFLAFLGSFIIISLPTFMTDMPMLNRQETAFIFFTLLLNVLFAKNFSRNVKWFLFLLFGIGLTLSHYSTTYITLGLFIGTSLLYLAINIIRLHPNIKTLLSTIDSKIGIEHNATNLELGMVILLTAITIIWNFNVTHTSNGIMSTITNIENDLTTVHIAKSKSDPASYGLLHIKKPSQNQLLAGYVDNLTLYVRKFNTDAAFFPQNIWSQFPVTLGAATKLPLSTIGKFVEKYHVNPFAINNFLKDAYAKTIQLFIVIGFLFIFWYKKHIKELKKEHLILIFVFFGLLIAQTVLPSNSINYGILRLFQQGLILLMIPLIIGALSVFSIFDKIHKSIKIYILSLLFIFFFLYLSGFLPTLTGGYYPQLNLSNSGFYYEAYYSHKEEIASINWLLNHKIKKTPIQSDWFTGNKFHTYGGVYTLNTIIPSAIRINSYVYASYSNIQTGQMMVYVNGAPIYYYFPFSFLDQNKNLIYDNGGSKIYR